MPSYSIKKEDIKEMIEESCFFNFYSDNIKGSLGEHHKKCSEHYNELKKISLYSSVIYICRCIDEYINNDFDIYSEEMILNHEEMFAYTFLRNAKGIF